MSYIAPTIYSFTSEVKSQLDEGWEVTWISVHNNGFIYVKTKNGEAEREYVFTPDKKLLYSMDKGNLL